MPPKFTSSSSSSSSMIGIALLAFAWNTLSSALSPVRIDTSSRSFIDDSGRTLIFRGVNAVYKLPPYLPSTTGYDSESTLSDIDALQLQNWGFNIVRLGVMWPGVEPTKGSYNETYFDELEKIVRSLEQRGIYVLLDFHQDLWHRKFCGEGVPDYVFDLCQSEQPDSTAQFPLPSRNSTSYPVDAEGNPSLEWCLETSFATYYLSAEVGAGFQCLYENTAGAMWEALAGYWQAVARRFRSFDNVLGYELINEPWAGDVYKVPAILLPKYAEKNYLQPLYEYLHLKIREVDDAKIIFFEGLTISYWPTGFTSGPGGSSYNDRQAFAYHIYCPINLHPPLDRTQLLLAGVCAGIDDEFFLMRNRDSGRLGVPLMMTEFGAAEDTVGDLVNLESVARLADRHQQSWMYWQYKYYEDLTTVTPRGESLFEDDGSVCTDKLRILSRTYPRKVAGRLLGFEFDVRNALFTMSYLQRTTMSYLQRTAEDRAPDFFVTEIYYNRELYYPRGVMVEIAVKGAGRAIVQEETAIECDVEKRVVRLVQMGVVANSTDSVVEVTLSHCDHLVALKCTCA